LHPRSFCHVPEAKSASFTRAAGELAMTQPAVSFQVKQLEDELGARLIDRSTRELRLTPAGHRVLFYAEQIIALHEAMQREFASGR
jgi:DNA-binding transcriptional LysR family regulator